MRESGGRGREGEHARCPSGGLNRFVFFWCRATVTEAVRWFGRIKEWVVAEGLQNLTVSRHSHRLAYRVGGEEGGNEWEW